MYSIRIHTDNEADLKLLIRIAKRLNAKVERRASKYENPKNVAEVKKRIAEIESGNAKRTRLTPELRKELFGQ